MKVSASQPFQLVYSLYQHEYLGYLFESFVVHVNEKGKLTFQHQNISSKNAKEFSSGMDDKDFEILELIDLIQQDAVIRKFSNKSQKPDEFFIKNYRTEDGNTALQDQINAYIQRKMSLILSKLPGKEVYEMGKDGEPAWKKIEVEKEKATILFHFRRNEENTHYFPTIKWKGQKLDFQYKNAYLVCDYPAWLVVEGHLITFEKEVDGKKIKPFLNKKFIVIPRKMEETYYAKFVAPLIESFDVFAKGFEIETHYYKPLPLLRLSTLSQPSGNLNLFDGKENNQNQESLVMELSFDYQGFRFKADRSEDVNVKLVKDEEEYTFHRISRRIDEEKKVLEQLKNSGLNIKHAKSVLRKSEAFEWLKNNQDLFEELSMEIIQEDSSDKTYFIGEANITIDIKENIDWFDIKAEIRFGEFKISFAQLRKYLQNHQTEFTLPNGQIAVIPESWLVEYSELFSLAEEGEEDENMTVKKHHVALLEELHEGKLAKLTMSRKLEKLRDFNSIDPQEVPKSFNGELRPYQYAGYNWMSFLRDFNFGGCLADDMGLGKTVQALTLLLSEKERGVKSTSLLVLPTSLVYNWEKEAQKFTPELKTFCYIGTQRDKKISYFKHFDLVITTYGTVRLDIDILEEYHFNYVILDESQAIKNPSSNISKAVRFLKSKNRLILTGTPLENSTMDLWSQIDFINPGLLGNKSYFKKEFLTPIEKKGDEKKTQRLNNMIKPFILRRHKSQVATELPEKMENVYYSSMSETQEEVYEKTKNAYRNEIMSKIKAGGKNKNQLLILQGLTKLRQIANHPILSDENYEGTSGKMEDILEMIHSVIGNEENHKILIFSQFVKHLKLFRNQLDEEGLKYCYLDGGTRDRMKEVDLFQNSPDIKLFLISLKAGGLGLNLTEADYVFILDPWWNPAAEAQAIDRSHRIGQKNTVFAYKFITRNTVEEKILMLQQKKLKLSQDLITTESSFVKSLTTEDIESILS